MSIRAPHLVRINQKTSVSDFIKRVTNNNNCMVAYINGAQLAFN